MNVEREFLRGVVPVHVLHHAAQEPVHGAWMSAELARHGYSISPGTLYPLLHRMQRDGLLESSTHAVQGRVLRSYRATAEGVRVLVRLREMVSEVAKEVIPGAGAPTVVGDADGEGVATVNGAVVRPSGTVDASPGIERADDSR